MSGGKCVCGAPLDDNWFDRSLCACGVMHQRCAQCGAAQEGCEYEETPVERVAREDHDATVRLYGAARVAELEQEANK